MYPLFQLVYCSVLLSSFHRAVSGLDLPFLSDEHFVFLPSPLLSFRYIPRMNKCRAYNGTIDYRRVFIHFRFPLLILSIIDIVYLCTADSTVVLLYGSKARYMIPVRLFTRGANRLLFSVAPTDAYGLGGLPPLVQRFFDHSQTIQAKAVGRCYTLLDPPDHSRFAGKQNGGCD